MATKKLQRPSVSVVCQGANQYATNDERRVLIIGEVSNSTNTATATVNEVVEDVNVLDSPTLFGADSQLNLAVIRFKEKNPLTQLDVLPTVSGTSTNTAQIGVTYQAGFFSAETSSVVTVNIGGDKQYFNIEVGDTTANVVTKIFTLYQAHPLFTANNLITQVEINTKQRSASLTDVPIVITQSRESGIKFSDETFSFGNSIIFNTDLSTILTERYTSIIIDGILGTDRMVEYTENVCNLTNEIRDGVGFVMKQGSIAEAKTFASLHNEKTFVSFYNLDEMKYNIMPLVGMAEIVALRELRLVTNANVADYVTDYLENFGGINKATLPYFNTPLTFGKPVGYITEADLTILIEDGISLFTTCCNRTVLSEVVTQYKTNEAGNRDYSWHFLNYVDTMSVIREFIVNNLRQRFNQTRMTDRDLVAGVSMANNGSLKSALVRFLALLSDKGRVHERGIVRTGFSQYIADSIVIEQDLTRGAWVFRVSVPIVTQVRLINGTLIEVLDIDFSLGQQF